MRYLPMVIMLLVLNLTGCGNSGNPSAPVSTGPHETGWVTYHRNDIIKDAAFSNISNSKNSGLLIQEHVIQCRVCHGAGLMGAKADAAGPACLDCHVLDPVQFPILCYSCHGGGAYPAMKPQQWYSTNRTARPELLLDSTFINRVRSNPAIHAGINHKTNSNRPIFGYITQGKCDSCHGGPNNIGEPHHSIVMLNNPQMGCLGPLPNGCHTLGFVNGRFALITPKCEVCHN